MRNTSSRERDAALTALGLAGEDVRRSDDPAAMDNFMEAVARKNAAAAACNLKGIARIHNPGKTPRKIIRRAIKKTK